MRPPGRRWWRGVLRRLEASYGRRAWSGGSDAVGELVGTILSQNTSGANASAGLRRLRQRFASWSAVADAPVRRIERCIRVAGLGRVKAPRIRAILRAIRDRTEGRSVSLAFLRDRPDEEAYEYLLAFDGVGPKTAACVLMFAFGRQLFGVDTHVRRIAIRLGVLDERCSLPRAQEALTPQIAPADRYALHVLLIAHGRAGCRARNPQCKQCPLLRLCAFGRRTAPRSRASVR